MEYVAIQQAIINQDTTHLATQGHRGISYPTSYYQLGHNTPGHTGTQGY